MKLLFAEDTRDLNRAVTAVLTSQGYEVDSVYDGAEALEHIQQNSYDGIILDIMRPKTDGISVLREIRGMGELTPVLLLTAKAEVDDRVAGLDAGADDYLPKPFAMKELLARVRSMMRRRVLFEERDLEFGDFQLKANGFELLCENSIRLSGREYELLKTLVQSGGKSLDTRYLLEHVWADEPDAAGDTVWLYISYLRSKLQAVSSAATIRGERGGSFVLLR